MARLVKVRDAASLLPLEVVQIVGVEAQLRRLVELVHPVAGEGMHVVEEQPLLLQRGGERWLGEEGGQSRPRLPFQAVLCEDILLVRHIFSPVVSFIDIGRLAFPAKL